MSNYLFLPITVVLLCILVCDKAIGPSISDSYLNYDCNQTCWKDSHISKAVPASFLIIVYVPMAILYRTLWQEGNTNINIRTNSLYLVIKNIAYVALVVLGKILKTDYRLAHSLVFGVIVIAILIFINKAIPYNFDRANLWAKIMLTCVVWNTLVCIISMCISSENLIWVLLQVLGWISILITGLVMQSKLPSSLIVSRKGRSISGLFRFEFGFENYENSQYKDFESEEEDNEVDNLKVIS
jgi:hypothetical protein